MKPKLTTHQDYRAELKRKLRVYSIYTTRLPKSVQELISKFSHLDLSPVDSIMQSKYSDVGRPPRLPSSMWRSMMVMVELKVTRFVSWVEMMRTTPVYAIISGFDPANVPGFSSFYDFMKRLWNIDTPNISPEVKPLPTKLIKPPKGKGKKADSIESETTAELITRLSQASFSLDAEAYGTLFEIFRTCSLDVSIRKGIIDLKELNIAGDGTPVVTAARHRYHRICDCKEKGITNCTCDRRFSQPDTDTGWDSSRNCPYVGYDMYLVTDTRRDLPLFPFLNRASMHDSHGFCENFFRFKTFAPDLLPSNLILDSAHDNMTTYDLCHSLSIKPFIDLNPGNARKNPIEYYGFTLDTDGIPICKEGIRMKSNGCDLSRQQAKFRCPRMWGCSCMCKNKCSEAKFGRTLSLPMAKNRRQYTNPPRGSEQWKKMYNKRTASERCNKRMKNDFLLEQGHHRKTVYWYVRVYVIMMLQHLAAWQKP